MPRSSSFANGGGDSRVTREATTISGWCNGWEVLLVKHVTVSFQCHQFTFLGASWARVQWKRALFSIAIIHMLAGMTSGTMGEEGMSITLIALPSVRLQFEFRGTFGATPFSPIVPNKTCLLKAAPVCIDMRKEGYFWERSS